MDNQEHKKIRTVWRNMFMRCYAPWNQNFHSYGGRGITVCDSWRDFEVFLRDMGDRPSGFSIERVDNNKGYCKENCVWSTPYEQTQNRRKVGRVVCDGEFVPFCEAAKRKGILESTVRARLRMGWTVNDALNTPANFGNKYKRKGELSA